MRSSELRRALVALQFLTRLPVPAVVFEPDWLPRCAKYFPLVGMLVGGLAGAVLAGAARLWPEPIPALLAVTAAMLLTGALHEDGLADSADSLGGRTRGARLAIMKDSRIGTFGALALILCVGLRVASLAAMPVGAAVAALVAAHALGRLAAVLLMTAQPYAGDRVAAKVVHAEDRPRGSEIMVALAFGLAPLLLLPAPVAGAALLVALLAAGIGAWRLCRVLGGYTGDVLGAAITLAELGVLLGAAIR